MLYEIEILEVRRVAELAGAARTARDNMLAPVREAELGEPPPARGEHHAAGNLGFAGLPSDDPAQQALVEAVVRLPSDIRRKLWAVMRIGAGDYARRDWDLASAAADRLPDETVIRDLTEDVDVHDKLMKGLFEIGAAERPVPEV